MPGPPEESVNRIFSARHRYRICPSVIRAADECSDVTKTSEKPDFLGVWSYVTFTVIESVSDSLCGKSKKCVKAAEFNGKRRIQVYFADGVLYNGNKKNDRKDTGIKGDC